MGYYFIKDMTVHMYPLLDNHVEYDGEKVYGAIPKGDYIKCTKCFGKERIEKQL